MLFKPFALSIRDHFESSSICKVGTQARPGVIGYESKNLEPGRALRARICCSACDSPS